MKVKYEEMFPDEFKEALNKNPIAYVPLGSLEYHGYHNVLGLDSLKGWKICELAARMFGGIVFPPLYLGVDTWPDIDLEKYPNKQFDSYHIPSDVYKNLLHEYFYRMNRIGFKTIFVLCGHYPNADVARKVTQDFQEVKIIVKNEADLVPGEEGDHAGTWETSLMMELFPELVDIKKIEGKSNPLMAIDGEDPRKSSRELGKQALEKILEGIKKNLTQ